jgi:hypothetical protein
MPPEAVGGASPPMGAAPAAPYREYLIVTGGRTFADRPRLWAALDAINAFAPPRALVIVTGGGKGTKEKPSADFMARWWAVEHEIDYETYPAPWKAEGKRAGPLRNQRMLEAILARKAPVMVLECPGGNGTADMVWRARAAGVIVSRLVDDGA